MWYRHCCILGLAAAVLSAADLAQYRITAGLAGGDSREYKGRITVSGGELAGLEGWRFSQGDRASAGGAFDFRTKIAVFEDQLRRGLPYGQTDWNDPAARRLIPQGMILRVRGSAPVVRFESGAGSFEFRDVPFTKPLSVLGGDGLIERLPIDEKLSEAGPADDYPAIAVAPDGARWVAWISYSKGATEVLASGRGRLHRLTGRGDHHAPALAVDGKGRVRAAWSQKDGDAYQLYGAVFDGAAWSRPEALTSGPGSNLWPRLVSDGGERFALAWQGLRQGQSVIVARLWDGSRWSPERRISEGPGNAWTPSAAFGAGRLWIAWDSYASSAYQVYAREWGGRVERITRGENFSVRPAVAVLGGAPVVAWEESGPLWGKDFAFLFDRRGTTLYRDRRIRVVFRDGRGWKALPGPVEDALPPGIRRFVQQPQFAVDGEKLYLAFRCRTSAVTARMDFWANNGRWESFLTYRDGGRWAPAIPMPSSVGRNGMRAALAAAAGSVQLVWPTDNRVWPTPRYGDLEIHAAAVPVTAPAAKLAEGEPIEAAPVPEKPNPNEVSDTRRIRDYRIAINGKQYRILRGDLHRHTELSGDGAGDGSLDDLYRYELDAAAFDYGYVGDHQMGGDEEYNWWLTQQSNDLYFMPQRFVPMYGYERSVPYPNGHRNVIWAERGKPVLRIAPAEAKGGTDSGPILYPYLRETGGIATSHSSATAQGTDWRDNDPELEPFVEIWQGFEANYENEDAPRAWKEGMRAVHTGLRPLGYVWNAWKKGYKLGVQASSDHVSTHTSYACILAEEFTRKGLLDGMRKRHAYAATDLIVLDYRIAAGGREALMGDIAEISAEPRLIVKVLGTAPIERIDVIRNNAYVHKLEPNRKEVTFEYADRAIEPGESYYYVRVEQSDGQLAWSSPIWVRYKR